MLHSKFYSVSITFGTAHAKAKTGSALSANRLEVKIALEIAFDREGQLSARNLLINAQLRSFTFASKFWRVKSPSNAEPG